MTKTEQQTTKPKTKKSILRSFIGAVFTAFWLGLLVLISLNAYHWSRKGYNTMMLNLNNDYQTEVSSLMIRNNAFATYIVSVFKFINSKFKKIQPLLQHTKDKTKEITQTKNKNNFISGLLTGTSGYLQKIGCMLWACFKILLFKCISIFGAALIYLFASLLGALDGLVSRYIRTAEGGRESTFIFHKMTNAVIQFPIWLVVIYLISPALINPMLIIALLALSFFVVFNIATSNLKKFL
jgi:hypothetical protein